MVPPPRRQRLFESFVQDAYPCMVAIRRDFTIAFASDGVLRLLGYQPGELEEANVADHIHPEDLERAALALDGWGTYGAPSGSTGFRFRHADGRWIQFDVTAAHLTDGEESYLGVYAQPTDYQHATDAVLASLLQGADRATALEPVLDVFSWQANDSQVAIAWYEPGHGHQFVSTGIPKELSGADDRTEGPWAEARETGKAVIDRDLDTVPADLTRIARQLDRGGVWVVPVPDAGSNQPALVTVWAPDDGRSPAGHSFGMSIAQTYVELILRWSEQAAALNDAARRDALTGLRNRTSLFAELESGTTTGALLFCDLDHFKPVNDLHGHLVGDEVLRAIARRIEHSARRSDLVARTGGDEFVVLARGVTAEQAAALAQRIRFAVGQPLSVAGCTVTVGVTIGVTHSDELLDEKALVGADQALMAAKADERGTVRWAPGLTPPI
ncbi:MAG: sensor domain-containing diguanylate cyclase [Acidimicrobiales bacterium]